MTVIINLNPVLSFLLFYKISLPVINIILDNRFILKVIIILQIGLLSAKELL